MLLRQIFLAAFSCLISVCGLAQFCEIKQYSLTDGLPSNLICCMEQDSRGLLWVGTWRGLCCFDGYEFLSFNDVSDPMQRPVCSRFLLIKTDKHDNVWCLTTDRRAYMFSPTDCQWTDVSEILEEKFGSFFRIANVYPLESGVVWLKCYDDVDYVFRIADVSDLKGVTNEFGRMKEPRNFEEKKFWFTKKAPPLDSAITELASLDNYFVDAQRNVWSIGNKLIRLTPKTSLFTFADYDKGRATRTIPELPDIDGCQVYTELTDSKGRQWRGTKGGGLYLNGVKQNIKGSEVFDIYEDSQGHVWVACNDGGFNLLVDDESSSPVFVSQDNGLVQYPTDSFARARHITETSDGIIFLSTTDGIVCFTSRFDKPEDIRFHTYTQCRHKAGSLPGAHVMQTLQASDGQIYISTMSGGLVKVKSGHPLKDDLVFQPVEKTQDTDGIVLAFVEDNNGCLWLAREDYLEKYDLVRDESLVFGSKDFGREISFSEAHPVRDKESGRIAFGTYGGALSFDPDQLVKGSFCPNILFSSVEFQGSQERHPILYSELLDVPSDRRNLTIYFSALDYQDNEHVQYAYKLVNDNYDVDKDDGNGWNYVGRAHCASFNNLPHGHLRLLVKSTNADGVWSDNIAQLRIFSHPVFWETPWAWLLYAVIVLGIVAVAVYIVQLRNRHRRERESLERKLQQLLASIETSSASQEPATADAERRYSLPEVEIESEEKKLMERLLVYLNENIANSDLKISDLAEAVNMSRSVFYDRIKSVTGMSPIDFLRYLRIQRARQMLASTDLPIAEIAYGTGFADPTYFAKVFKKSVGLSPNSFRKSQSETAQQ